MKKEIEGKELISLLMFNDYLVSQSLIAKNQQKQIVIEKREKEEQSNLKE